MKFTVNALVCLLVAVTAAGQSASQGPALKTRPATDLPVNENSSVSPETPVITVQGLCEKKENSSAAASECKTVITRQDFEKILQNQTLTAPQKKQVADRLVHALILEEKGQEAGLDHTPEFETQMYVARLSALANLELRELQKQSNNVSEAEIQDYFDKHKADYKTISFDRLYVPKQKNIPTSADKPDTADLQKKREASEAEMKAEADKLRARAVAGEDFTKLQQEAYDFAGITQKAQTTKQENVRKTGVLASDASIFELNKGDVSQVFDDPAGFMVYKVEEVKDQPLTAVHDEVLRALQAEKFKVSMDALTNSVKTTLDDAYFAAPSAPTLRNPGEAPSAKTAPPSKTPSGK